MIKKFRKTGSLLDKNRNRQKPVLTPGILQDIQTAINPHKSLRKLSAQTGISLGSLIGLLILKYGPLLS